MRLLHRPPAPTAVSLAALIALALGLGLAGTAKAQTWRYSELDIYPPSLSDTSSGQGTDVHGNATTVQSNGDAFGWATVRSGTTFDWESFRFVPAYKRVVLRWPAAASGKVAPVAVSTTLVPLHVNDAGNWAGYVPSRPTSPRFESGVRYLTDKPAVRLAGQVSTLSYGVNGRNFEVLGLNNRNWVLGSTLVEGRTPPYVKGLVWKNGTYTELEAGGAEYAYVREMNDNGDVVGRLQTNVMYDSGPDAGTLKEIRQQAALWVGNRLAWVGPLNSEAVSVNARGEVLWLDLNTRQVYVRSGGVDTPVPFDGKLTNRGTVVGCHLRGDGTFKSALAVWHAGTVTIVEDAMRAAGVPLPGRDGDCAPVSVVDVDPEGRQVILTRGYEMGTSRPSGLVYLRIQGLP